MADRPNLLLINVDQMRGDCLGIAGHPVVETPNLDYLAQTGVRFTRAYSACPTCIPARAAMLTGMAQEHHGRVGYKDGVPWRFEHTLPGELARAGYHTQGVGKMHFHPSRSLQGFHNVVLHDGYLHFNRNRSKSTEQHDDYIMWLKEKAGADVDYTEHGIGCNSWVARAWHLPERLHPTNWVVHQSIDFLRRRDPEKPFFLWMSFVRPHAPLDPPQSYFDQYLRQDIPLPPVGEWVDESMTGNPGLSPDAKQGKLREPELRRALAAYYALITHIDHQIGRFLEALNEYGELHNTIMMFVSDHGELLGDHHLFRKSLPYEGSARVPMILKLPRGYQVPRGLAVSAPVELRDIMPTFLEAAGCEIPASVDGASLLPWAKGETPEWRGWLHGEHTYGSLSNQWLTDGHEKYIWFSQSGEEQLFDLDADPLELHDLAKEATAESAKVASLGLWRERLVKVLQGREEGFVEGGRLVPGRRVTDVLAR